MGNNAVRRRHHHQSVEEITVRTQHPAGTGQKRIRHQQITNEIKVYTKEDHLNGKSEDVVELYDAYKTAILNLNNDIKVSPKKQTIGFTSKEKVFINILLQKSSLKIWINLKKGQLDDPKNLSRDVSGLGHWGNGDYELVANDTKYLEYIMSLVKQAIN